MYQCPNCKGWIDANDGSYRHECVDTLQKIAAKVAEHKDQDYQLAKAAFTVLHWLKPKVMSSAWMRAKCYQLDVWHRNRKAWQQGYDYSSDYKPRRRWQDKDAAK